MLPVKPSVRPHIQRNIDVQTFHKINGLTPLVKISYCFHPRQSKTARKSFESEVNNCGSKDAHESEPYKGPTVGQYAASKIRVDSIFGTLSLPFICLWL